MSQNVQRKIKARSPLEFDFQTQSKLINIFLDIQPREVV